MNTHLSINPPYPTPANRQTLSILSLSGTHSPLSSPMTRSSSDLLPWPPGAHCCHSRPSPGASPHGPRRMFLILNSDPVSPLLKTPPRLPGALSIKTTILSVAFKAHQRRGPAYLSCLISSLVPHTLLHTTSRSPQIYTQHMQPLHLQSPCS